MEGAAPTGAGVEGEAPAAEVVGAARPPCLPSPQVRSHSADAAREFIVGMHPANPAPGSSF